MDNTRKSFAPACETFEQLERSWPQELKLIAEMLIDLAARTFEAKGTRLVLNEVLTAEELAVRFKVPVSTVEELARKGKLPGAFRVGKHWRFDLDLLRSALPSDDASA